MTAGAPSRAAPAPGRPARRGRERYLDAALDLARGATARAGAGDHLAALVGPRELAARVGVGRTALYKAWPSRGDLWTGIVEYANYAGDFARPDSELPWPPPPGSLDPIDITEPPWIEVIRQQANTTSELAFPDPNWVIRATALAYPEAPGVARSRAAVEAYRMATLARRIAIGVSRGQRDFSGPFALAHLAEAMWAIMDGIVVTSHWYEPLGRDMVVSDDGSGPQPWYLGSWAYRALLFELTQVVPAGRQPLGPFHADDFDPGVLSVPRWTRSQRSVLAAGAEAIVEGLSSEHRDAALAVLPHVTIDRVARATGVSRRAVYDVWGTRDGLLLDLLDELLWAEHRQQVRLTESVWPPSSVPTIDPPTFAATMFGGGNQDYAGAMAVSAFLPQSRRADVRRLLVEHHRRSVDYLAGQLARLDPAVEAITPAQLAELLVALVAGLRRVRRVHGDQGWAGELGVTFGWAVAGLCRHRPSQMS